MPKPSTSRSALTSDTVATNPAVARASKRAALLIERLLQRLEVGVKAQDANPSPEWKRLFGTTQSAVANVQKLVQALAALPNIQTEHGAADSPQEAPMSKQELLMLKEWLNS